MRPILLIFCWMTACCAQPEVNPHAATLQDFDKRVTDYSKLRKSIDGKLPKLKSTPSQHEISHYQRELAKKIRHARVSAKQGDIFTPEIAAEFRRVIGLMRGNETTRVMQSIKSAEPVHMQIGVNDAYPEKAPLQSMPPTLLQNLPKLPPELEYRLVGRDLVLLDGKANLVVDFMPQAMP